MVANLIFIVLNKQKIICYMMTYHNLSTFIKLQ